MRGGTPTIVVMSALALAGCASAPALPEGFVAGEGIETLSDAADQVQAGFAAAHATWFDAGGARYVEAVTGDDGERADWVIRAVCVTESHVDYVFVPPEQVADFAATDANLCP